MNLKKAPSHTELNSKIEVVYSLTTYPVKAFHRLSDDMTAASPVSQSSSYQWKTETTRTTTAPTGETWRTETIRTNEQPQTGGATWREGNQNGSSSWRSERQTTRTVERQVIPQQTQQPATNGYTNGYSSEYNVQSQRQQSQRPTSGYSTSSDFRAHSSMSDATANRINPVDQRLSQLMRPESRQSNPPSEQGSVVNDTLNALATDVEQTTEIIRRRQEQMRMERRQFQTEMEVTGRISVEPSDDWLSARLKNVSTDDLKRDLSKIKEDQRTNAVTDTLAALVYDVNATAEVLRRKGTPESERKKRQAKEEIEYRLRLTPSLDEEVQPFPSPKPREHGPEEKTTLEEMNRDYGVEVTESQTASLRRRAHSETPRRTLQIESSPPPSSIPICAYCNEEIDGQILTALAPNSDRAQKFHTYHFMCTYCQKTLNMHGTYREHDKKPYCHDCFYKLYNGLLYSPDEHQSKIEKLI